MSSTQRKCKKRKVSNNNCQHCSEMDDKRMVQCKKCNERWHYICVGIGAEIANFFWICNPCAKGVVIGSVPLVSANLHRNPYNESTPTIVDNQEDLSEQNPVTLSEKLSVLQSEFQTLYVEFDKWKIDHQECKDQLIEAQREILKCKKATDELQAEFSKLEIDHRLCTDQLDKAQKEILEMTAVSNGLRAEVSELKEKVEMVTSSAEEVVGASSIENTDKTCVVAASVNETAKEIDDASSLGSLNNKNTGGELLMKGYYLKLPCQSIKQYEQMKLDLTDIVLFDYIEKSLGTIGGTDLKTCIVGVMNRLMTDDVQSKLSLSGKRTDKPGIIETTVMRLINSAVRITHPNYKDKDGESIIGRILVNK